MSNPENQPKEIPQMDLNGAKVILQRIASIPAAELTNPTSFDQLKGLSLKDIRTALGLVATEVMTEANATKVFGTQILKWPIKSQALELKLYCSPFSDDTPPQRVTLLLNDNLSEITTLSFDMQLTDQPAPGGHSMHYLDNRPKTKGSVTVKGNIFENADFPILFKGIRWLSISLLNDNARGFFMPEDNFTPPLLEA